MDNYTFHRTLVTYGIMVPVVLLMGYILGAPSGAGGYMLIAILFCIMLAPLILNYHHIVLVATWNACFTLGFLPGLPKVWYVIALVSLVMTLLTSIVHRKPLLSYRPLTWSILLLLAVAVGTSLMRGGIGMRATGSGMYGGKAFVQIFIAIVGYFALSSVKVPKRKALLCVGLYFLTTLTLVLSNVVYEMGEKFWFLYLFVPVDYAMGQAQGDIVSSLGIRRYAGVGFALMGVYFYMMVRYGIRGIFNMSHPFRWITLLLIVTGSLMGGFRSTLILYALVFGFHFWLERLYKTKMLLYLLAAAAVFLSVLYPTVQKLPIMVQRSFSFLPGLKIDLVAQTDADASVEWRLKIWSIMWDQIGEYLLLGKGFVYDASDVQLAEESARRGFLQSEDFASITGDYHSGPLSVIIPLGIWGVLAFLFVNIFGMRMLYLYHKYGDPDLYTFNLGMLALFVSRIVYFWVFFGAIASELCVFVGILGLSLAINGKPRRTPWVSEEEEEQDDYAELQPPVVTPVWKSAIPTHRVPYERPLPPASTPATPATPSASVSPSPKKE